MKKLFKSFGNAINGIKACGRKETNFKIHLVSLLLVTAAAVFWKLNSMEWIILLLCAGFVLAAELLNTCIEQVCNLVSANIHPGIKNIKDMAAGAVLVAALTAVVCGCIIFLPKIFSI